MKRSQWLFEIITYLLILLFLYTALTKVLDWHHYVRKMNNQVFPKMITPTITFLIPLVEFIAVGLLVSSKTRIKGLWLAFVLMASFTVYVALVTLKVFPRVPCSCAGVFEVMSWIEHLIFNLIFTAMAFYAILIKNKEKSAGTSVPAF
jgi:putative oxidoreductase